MTDFIILPGIGGSGEDHWQTRWQRTSPSMRPFQPGSWDRPDPRDWIEALDVEIAQSARPPILVAHSLSCLLVALWQRSSTREVMGAFLVAVPDPASSAYPPEALGFSDVATAPLRFPSMIVASSDDPYGSVAYSASRAEQWGSDLVVLGPLGHINGASGVGDWPEGWKLLNRFEAEVKASH